MFAKYSIIKRTAGLVTASVLVASGAKAASPEVDELQDPQNNFITALGTFSSISGNKAAFQSGTQMYKSGANGIEEMRFGKDFSKDTNFQFDGKILSGVEDYLSKIKITKDEVGSVEVGYKRFRTFYDGVGGFFANNNGWMPLSNQYLHVDRGTFWANATIAKPNAPVFNIRYSNELRSGRKESTITGDTDITGIPIWSLSSLNTISANRKIVPGYYDLSERHEVLEGSMTHKVGNTTIDARLVSDNVSNLDTRYMVRYPGELKPYPAIPSNPAILIDPLKANNQISGYDQQGIDSKSLSFIGKIETELSKNLSVYAGLTYMTMSGDLTGSRINTQYLATSTGMLAITGGYATNGRPPYSYVSLGGVIKNNLLAANVGADYKGIKNLTISTGLKAEQVFTRGSNPVHYISTWYDPATAATAVNPVDMSNTSRSKERAWVPEVSLRYTGITRVTLFADADYRFSPGNEQLSNGTIGPSGTTVIGSYTTGDAAVRENHGSYKIGANWLACKYFTLRGEVFMKNHNNGFYDNGAADSKYLLGYNRLGSQIVATVKPMPTVVLTTKLARSVANMWTTVDTGSRFESMDSAMYQIGETIDWTPTKDFYLQANVNMVYDITRSAYTRTSGIARDVVENADNDYMNGSFVAGMAVDEGTNLELRYTYYRADNNIPKYSTVAYGADAKEYTYTAGLKQKLSKSMTASIKVGYFFSESTATGGLTNYKGTLAYVSVTHTF